MSSNRSSGMPGWAKCIAIGLLAGLFSGLFGVGGGTVIVPLLVLLCGFDQRDRTSVV